MDSLEETVTSLGETLFRPSYQQLEGTSWEVIGIAEVYIVLVEMLGELNVLLC